MAKVKLRSLVDNVHGSGRTMRRLVSATVILTAFAANPSGASAQANADPAYPRLASSLCRAPEVALFTCDVASRKVSICGNEGQGGAVYRFGRPGHIELGVTDLHRASTGFAGGGEDQVYADTLTDRYIVYDKTVRTGFGDDGHFDPKETSGLVVQHGRTISSRLCAQPAIFAALTQTLVPAGDYVRH